MNSEIMETCNECKTPDECRSYTGCQNHPAKEQARNLLDAPTCLMEVEIHEYRRRYVTIEIPQEIADRICKWTLKYPTASEEQAAIDAVKAANVIKEEVIEDTYEIHDVDFPSDSQ